MVISSDEDPDVPPRAALDGRTLDVIVREIVRGLGLGLGLRV